MRVWTKNTIGWEIFEQILKIFDENSIEKSNFYLFVGKVVKNRAFRNNIFFLQQFFPVRPCVRHCIIVNIVIENWKMVGLLQILFHRISNLAFEIPYVKYVVLTISMTELSDFYDHTS